MRYKIEVTSADRLSPEQRKELGLAVDEDGYALAEYEEGYVQPFREISTLEELQEFVGRYGMIVLKEDVIEVYNFCRE